MKSVSGTPLVKFVINPPPTPKQTPGYTTVYGCNKLLVYLQNMLQLLLKIIELPFLRECL